MKVDVRGESFVLSPRRALVWPARRLLAVADLHLGKAETFQKSGLWLPSAAQANDLDQLRELVRLHDVESVVFLGDLVHSALGLTPDVIDLFATWLGEFPGQVTVTLGNHDQAIARRWPTAWSKANITDKLDVGDFKFQHIPPPDVPSPPGKFTWAGHVHPMVVLRSHNERLRLPGFAIKKESGILPAFSSLAGGFTLRPMPAQRLYAVGSSQVFKCGHAD